MIRAIFFDFDGVLTLDSSGGRTMAGNFCSLQGGQTERVLSLYREYSAGVNAGTAQDDVPWKRIAEMLQSVWDDGVRKETLGRVPINGLMLALARALRGEYEVGIITDNGRERMQILREDQRLGEVFDPIIVSSEVGATKQGGERTIYTIALRQAGCRPEEAIFIDNKQQNLVTPAAMGIRTIWHDDARNDIGALVAALRAWGVHVPAIVA